MRTFPPSSTIAKGALLFTTLIAVAASCGSVKQSSDNGDAGSQTDASAAPQDSGLTPFPDAGTFCSGDKPRMIINGAEVSVQSATGKAVILNCCDSGELNVATSAYQALFSLLWRTPAGQPAGSVNLANPPNSFSVELDLGCDPATAPCNTGAAEEHFSAGFAGTINYISGPAPTASYCVSVAEQPNSPHALIHSLQLYAPNVPTQ
jgi:hypothetical protein